MKITMKGKACGPRGHMFEGRTYNVSDVLGKQLVAAQEAVVAPKEARAENEPEAVEAPDAGTN